MCLLLLFEETSRLQLLTRANKHSRNDTDFLPNRGCQFSTPSCIINTITVVSDWYG